MVLSLWPVDSVRLYRFRRVEPISASLTCCSSASSPRRGQHRSRARRYFCTPCITSQRPTHESSTPTARARILRITSSSPLFMRMMPSSCSTHAVNCTSAVRSTGGTRASSRPSWPPQLRGCDAHVGCRCELEGLHVGSEMANVAVSGCGPMISATSCAPMRSSFFLSDFSSRRAVFGCVAHVCIAQQTQSRI